MVLSCRLFDHDFVSIVPISFSKSSPLMAWLLMFVSNMDVLIFTNVIIDYKSLLNLVNEVSYLC